MSLWEVRKQAEIAFAGELKMHYEIVLEEFMLLDKAILVFEGLADEDSFFYACGLILLKAKNYALGLLSLLMDGLAQEGGAMLRPLLECLEMLKYLRLHCDNFNEALTPILEGKMRAGSIAKAIEGDSWELRKYLNDNASHFQLSFESLKHCLDFKFGGYRKTQKFNNKKLLENTETLSAFLLFLLDESEACLKKSDERAGLDGLIDLLHKETEVFRGKDV